MRWWPRRSRPRPACRSCGHAYQEHRKMSGDCLVKCWACEDAVTSIFDPTCNGYRPIEVPEARTRA